MSNFDVGDRGGDFAILFSAGQTFTLNFEFYGTSNKLLEIWEGAGSVYLNEKLIGRFETKGQGNGPFEWRYPTKHTEAHLCRVRVKQWKGFPYNTFYSQAYVVTAAADNRYALEMRRVEKKLADVTVTIA